MASSREQELEPLTKKIKIQPINQHNNDDDDTRDTRPTCKYAERCFKSSAQHKCEFQHPKRLVTDSDHAQAASHGNNDIIPVCPHATACEETELIHFAEFSHPVQERKYHDIKEENECDDVEVSDATQLLDDDDDALDSSFSSS